MATVAEPNLMNANTEPAARPAIGYVIAVLAFGLLIRAAMLWLARDLEPVADESNYAYLAAVWARFGVYTDSTLYLWPPGYPFVLTVCLKLFGVSGIMVAKVVQVLLSGVVGWFVMLLAARLTTQGGMLLAGLIWAIHLPLASFTHYLWPETLYVALFLSGFYLLLHCWQYWPISKGNGYDRDVARLVAAGVLIGLSLLVKEVGLWWCVLVPLLVVWRLRNLSWHYALSRAALFVMGIVVVVLPWTLRNWEVYGRFVPVGATTGQNVYFGVNAHYMNQDYPPAQSGRIAAANATVRRWLTAPPGPAWERPAAHDVVELSQENVRRGIEFGREHPGFIAASRIKNLADWATPLSFFLRNYAVKRYAGPWQNPLVKTVMVAAALVVPLLVLAGAIGGYFHALVGVRGRGLIGWTLLYFLLANSMIVASSRYRMCIEPLLIVVAATFPWAAGSKRWSPATIAACLMGWVVLGGLWLINAAEVWEMIGIVMARAGR